MGKRDRNSVIKRWIISIPYLCEWIYRPDEGENCSVGIFAMICLLCEWVRVGANVCGCTLACLSFCVTFVPTLNEKSREVFSSTTDFDDSDDVAKPEIKSAAINNWIGFKCLCTRYSPIYLRNICHSLEIVHIPRAWNNLNLLPIDPDRAILMIFHSRRSRFRQTGFVAQSTLEQKNYYCFLRVLEANR